MQLSRWRAISRAAAVGTLSGLAVGALLATSAHAADVGAGGAALYKPERLVLDATYQNYRLIVGHLPVGETFQLKFDLSKLNTAVAKRQSELPSSCAVSATAKDTIDCDYTMTHTPDHAPHMYLPVPFKLEPAPGASGSAGSIAVTLTPSTTKVDTPEAGTGTIPVDVPATGAGTGTGASPTPGSVPAGAETLPVTGAQSAVLGGVGGAAVLLGVGLFVLARRRRVVLMTPGDETRSS
jgi:LPXTG-motif cell wall-anchored protein